MPKKKDKTLSDYHKPFAKIGNIDLHNICTLRNGERIFGIVVGNKTWELHISKGGKSVRINKIHFEEVL